MAFLLHLFRARPAHPPRVPTDTVIPLFSRDDNTPNRNLALEYTMQFDHVMEADRLRDALCSLIDRPGWRKLGSRLRMNAAGKLEYHLPAEFSKERPSINYTHKVHDILLAEHPIGAKLPHPNGKVQVYRDTTTPRKLFSPENETMVLADWTQSDKAQLGLHVVSFKDATFVTIVWLHTLLDAMGRHALLNAWIAVLEGREVDVPDFLGYDSDPLAQLGARDGQNSSEEEFILKDKAIQGLDKLRFIFNFVWELFWYPEEEGCVLIVPPSHFTKLKEQAFKDLDSLAPTEITYNTIGAPGTNPKPFLSDGDILTAWYMRLLGSCNNALITSPPSRLVNIMNVLGMRDILRNTSPALLPPTGKGVLINNCVSGVHSLFTVQEFLSLPLGHLAARIRKDIVLQSTREQLEAVHRLSRKSGGALLFGSGNMAFLTMSNWTKAKLFDMNFASAIQNEQESDNDSRATIQAKPKYIHVYATQGGGFSVRGSGSCVGRDPDGNWWLGTSQRKEWIPNLIKAVEGMQ